MLNQIKFKFFLAVFTYGIFNAAFSAEHQILMVNQGTDGPMSFEPGYLKLNVGDTVKFIAKDKTHNAESVAIPQGAIPFKGKIDEEIVVKIDAEGVYFYQCAPHLVMGMIGFVQAGNPVNHEEVKKIVETIKPKIVINKERIDKLMAQIR